MLAAESIASHRDIALREDVGIAETQIYMRVSWKMEDSVDVAPLQASDYVAWYSDIAMKRGGVRLSLQHILCARNIQQDSVIKLIKRHDVVVVWIREGPVACAPRSTLGIFGVRSAGKVCGTEISQL